MKRNEIIAQIRGLVREPGFESARQDLSVVIGDQLGRLLGDFRDQLARIRATNSPLGLRITDALSGETITQFDALDPVARGRVAKKLVMDSLFELPSRLAQTSLPAEILGQYLIAAKYIRASTLEQEDSSYGDRSESYFDRDLRVCELLTYPAGAQVLDLRVWIPKSFYRNLGIKENLRCMTFVIIKLGGRGPLLRIHTDTRNLIDFNEEGWNQCYVRIANLLEQMPEVRGMVGTSWFYDPQLLHISPKLSYLQTVPLSAGAFLRVDGPGEIHTQRAIARSPTRRSLYEEGRYLPVCATLVWPRKSIIEWSKRNLSL